MFSSKTDMWSTPQNFFDELNKEFHFTLDPCATKENAKCKLYFTEENNGLLQDWSGETVFCNPPYGRGLKDWVQKCYESSLYQNTKVVMLIPARTDTIYQHEFIFSHAKAILFLKGRLRFGDCKNSAPFPSQLVIYVDKLTPSQIKLLKKYGYLVILR